jgi:hypothetical protein
MPFSSLGLACKGHITLIPGGAGQAGCPCTGEECSRHTAEYTRSSTWMHRFHGCWASSPLGIRVYIRDECTCTERGGG